MISLIPDIYENPLIKTTTTKKEQKEECTFYLHAGQVKVTTCLHVKSLVRALIRFPLFANSGLFVSESS